MERTQTRTLQINVTRAELQHNGLPLDLPLVAMRCHETNTYDYNPVLRERTGGTWTYRVDLALRDSWSLLRFSVDFGGPQELMDEEFTLLVIGTTDQAPKPTEYKFNRFQFQGDTSGSYLSREPS